MGINVDWLKEDGAIVLHNNTTGDVKAVYGWDDVYNYLNTDDLYMYLIEDEIDDLEEAFDEAPTVWKKGEQE